MSEKTTIKIVRKRCFTGNWLSGTVVLDNEEVGSLDNGEEKTFETTAGNHKLYVKMKHPTETVEFDAAPEKSTEFEFGPSPRFLKFRAWAFVSVAVLVGSTCSPLLLPAQAIQSAEVLTETVMYASLAAWMIFLFLLNFKPGLNYSLKKI